MTIEVTAFDPDGAPRWHRGTDGALVRRRPSDARKWDCTVVPEVIGPEGEPTPTERIAGAYASLAEGVAREIRRAIESVAAERDVEHVWIKSGDRSHVIWSADLPVPSVEEVGRMLDDLVAVESRPGPLRSADVSERIVKAKQLRDEDRTWKEVAETLGVSVAQARRDVSRAGDSTSMVGTCAGTRRASGGV